MEKNEIKQIITSVLIGACVAFLQVFFAGIAQFFAAHANEITTGGTASMAYLAQKIAQKH